MTAVTNTVFTQTTAITESQTKSNDCSGTLWLRKAVKDQTASFESVFAIFKSICDRQEPYDNGWNVAHLFPERTISASQVAEITLKEFFALDPVDQFGIIDLLSTEQTLAILNSHDSTPELILALYYYNSNIAKGMKAKLNDLFKVSEEVAKKADEFFSKLKKYDPKEFATLQESAKYDEFAVLQLQASACLDYGKAKRWNKVSKEYLPKGLENSLSIELITNINNQVRPKFVHGKSRCSFPGMRTCSAEVSPTKAGHFLPGRAVPAAMDELIAWVNDQIKRCDKKEGNPILVAAKTYQQFIAIHPFLDGNGRTGRILSDMILRRYGLLPAMWNDHVTILSGSEKKEKSEALESLLEALERSYNFLTS